jgi:hypothetical protein
MCMHMSMCNMHMSMCNMHMSMCMHMHMHLANASNGYVMATRRRWGRRSLVEPHGGPHDVDQLADLVAALWHGDHVT